MIGTRTWGGEIWLSASNVLVDRGIATAAETGVYGPERQVADRGPRRGAGHRRGQPAARDVRAARDAQLEAAMKHLEELIQKDPRPVPAAPPYPVKAVQ